MNWKNASEYREECAVLTFSLYSEFFHFMAARTEAAASAFDYLEQNGLLLTMEDEVGRLTEERAINQLQELAQKGYCEMPEYEFKESFDHNGNSIWRYKCSIENHYYQTESYNKKKSKRKAAYLMLCDIMGYSIDEDDWD